MANTDAVGRDPTYLEVLFGFRDSPTWRLNLLLVLISSKGMIGSSALVEQNTATYGFTTVINKTNIGKVSEYCVNLLETILTISC
jgi:hypothetical protein